MSTARPPFSMIRSGRGLALGVLLAMVGVIPPGPATARTAADSTSTASVANPASAETSTGSAPLVLNNRFIVEFRGHFLGYGPGERAKAARQRIKSAIQEHARDQTPAVVEATETSEGWFFSVDGRWVFGLTPADVDALGGQTMGDLVLATRRNLDEAVGALVEQRSIPQLIRSIVFAVLATVIFWLVVRFLVRFVRWSGNRVQRAIESRTAKLNLPPSALINQLDNLARGIVKVIGVVVGLSLANVWLTFVLKQFPYTYPWGDQIDDYLISIGSSVGLAMLHAVPNLLMLALIYVVTRFIQRWVRLFYDAVREGRMSAPGIDAETAVPAQQLTTMFIWLLAVAIAYPFIPGSQGVAFKGVSVLLGLMLSLGSSNVVSQAASGYMLMFSKALRPGDFVRINEYEGVVMSLGVLSTKIRTPRDEEINVPNTLIVGSTMKNYTRLNKESGVPVVTTLTIGYDAPWRQVHALMLEAARRTKGLRANPEPRVLQAALSDFYVEYTLLARLEVIEGRAVVMSALHANLQDLFNEYGVQIMSPHFEGPPDYKVYVPKEKWYEAPATPEAETRTTPQGNEER